MIDILNAHRQGQICYNLFQFHRDYSKIEMNYIIRRMQDKDIPQALEIDHEAFPTQWPNSTYSSIKHELRNRLAHYLVAAKPLEPRQEMGNPADDHNFWHRLLQLKHLFDHDRFFGEEKPPPTTDYLVGIAGFWIMLDEAHIITIATRGTCRRQGIGELLLISVIDMAIQLKANTVTLEVRVSNMPAQALYEKYGFQKVGLRRRYYSDDGEDAFIMTVEDINSTPFQTLFQQLKEADRKERAELYA